MDPAVISALSAVLGSVVGGSASIATAWFSQTTQGRRESVRNEMQKRESLYGEFIAECSKLVIDALDHTLSKPEILVNVYSLENRIRLAASNAVVDAAAVVIKRILELYFGPNKSVDEFRTVDFSDDPIKVFSEACRKELSALRY
ncbi:MAG: hypothetical protein QOK44_3869 [Betaproteobacteria bacterium]|jgi:hypothetical protein|nr:hypothetical protein [Betaproteobacteria bacterium]